MLKPRVFGALVSLLLLCSCATGKPIHTRLPADVTLNKNAGRGGWVIVTLRLESGEELPFLLDTGAPWTFFDKSQEPRLGKRLGTGTNWNFGTKLEAGIYAAPKLYLGSTPLLNDRPQYRHRRLPEDTRASKTSPWRLQKAWRADQNGQMVEEYPVP